MSSVKVVQTWYRSLQADGSVWCESSNALEVANLSEGIASTFERLIIRQVTGDWEPWTPALDGGQPDTPAPTRSGEDER